MQTSDHHLRIQSLLSAVQKRPLWPVVSLTAFAALLRFFRLGAKSFWFDEGITFVIVHRGWESFCRLLWMQEGNMAFYYLLLRPWLHLGTDEFALRAPSVALGILTIPVLYLLGEYLFDRRVALLSALLLSCHTAHVRYSQEARGYSLTVLLCTLSFLLLERSVAKSSLRNWTLYVIVTALAVYTHLLAGLVVAAQVVSLFALPRRLLSRRALLASGGGIALLSLPAAIFVLTRDIGQIAWVPPPSIRLVHQVATTLTGNGVILLVYTILIVIALSSIAKELARGQPSLERWHAALVLCWFLVPATLLLAVSVVKPLFLPRFLLMSVPASALLAARGLRALRPLWLPLAVTVLLVATSLASLRTYYSKPNEDWRGVTRFILANARPGDAIVLLDQGAFDYYCFRSGKTVALPVEIKPGELPNPALSIYQLVARSQYHRVWMVGYDWRLVHDPFQRRLQRLLQPFYKHHEQFCDGTICIQLFTP